MIEKHFRQRSLSTNSFGKQKLHSLRSLIKLPSARVTRTLNDEVNPMKYEAALKKIQNHLNRDSAKEILMMSEPMSILPGYEQIKIQNKLWKYFLGRMKLVEYKVEKQQVNFCEKEVIDIAEGVNKRFQTNINNICKLKQIISIKYRQISDAFQEIKQEKSLKLFVATNKNKKDKKLTATSFNIEKAPALKQNIQEIRREVNNLQKQLFNIVSEQQKINKEWQSFLVNFVKNGYYMTKGISLILQFMIKTNYQPKQADFSQILDLTSKKCLLQQYSNLKQQAIHLKQQTKRQKSKCANVSDSKQSMIALMNKEQLRDVYKGTQQYMESFVRKKCWTDHQVNFPKIINQNNQKISGNWRQQQKKRISRAYQGLQLQKRVKGILFGPKVQTVQ